MTLTGYLVRNVFRNKRRSALTALSVGFSMLLLITLMCTWRAFYLDQGSPSSALRLFTRHRVSLVFFLPASYREQIRAVPGVAAVAPMSWFGGRYIDDRPEHFFAQFGTDPEEIHRVYPEWRIDPGQLRDWRRDRAGFIAERRLAVKHGWKVGQKIVLQRNIFPVDLELTLRGIFDSGDPFTSVFFDFKYVEEAVWWAEGRAGTFAVLTEGAAALPRVARTIDGIFHNAPQPTKSESEKAFQLGFIESLGNVKMFILSIGLAVVFAILLVTGNTMAMSIRERVREVATLRTLGFTRGAVLALFMGEALALSLAGGAVGGFLSWRLLEAASRSPMADMLGGISLDVSTLLAALGVAGAVGLASSFFPAWRASRVNIVDGLRSIG